MIETIIIIVVAFAIWDFIIPYMIKESKKSQPLGSSLTEYPEAYFRYHLKRLDIDAIESDISLDFYKNFEHKDNYIQSVVEYMGKKVCIVFYDWRQNPLRHLAHYFYKISVNPKK